MKTKTSYLTPLFVVLTALFFVASPAMAKDKKDKGKVKCQMEFNLKSWSALYKQGKGSGTITCNNGQSAAVKIKTHGGGITFGKDKIINGHGSFSKVHDIHELFGGYAESEAHAGAKKSATAKAIWNGDIGLTLTGTGKGWDLGFDFGQFKITPK
jgi:hypothetical protein